MLMLFDYDGVIVDSFAPLLELCIQAQRSLGLGRPPTRTDFRTIENLTFNDLGRSIGVPEDMVSAYTGRVFELQKKSWPVSLFPCVAQVLSELSAQHILAVITSSQTEAVTTTLRAAGLGKAISAVLGGECGKRKAERISMLRGRYAASSADTFMIGDAISDIREGKLAGVRTIAVSWGFQERELLSKEHPDFLVDAPQELLRIAACGQSAGPRGCAKPGNVKT